jgi:anti-sigma regulatory factor (Ser/Thr protein kinase)
MQGRGMTPTDLIIPADVEAGARARRAVVTLMGDHARVDDALLAVTELVNNAIVHGGLRDGADLSLTISSHRDRVRLTVRHAGPTFEVGVIGPPSNDPTASRGLAIVDQVADRWGVDSNGSEVTAWFEMSPGLSDPDRG